MWRNTTLRGNTVAAIGGADPSSRTVTIQVTHPDIGKFVKLSAVLTQIQRKLAADPTLGPMVSTVEINLFTSEGVARGIAAERGASPATEPKQDRRTNPQALQARVRRR